MAVSATEGPRTRTASEHQRRWAHSLDVLPAYAVLVQLPAQFGQREHAQVALVRQAHQAPLGVGRVICRRAAEPAVPRSAAVSYHFNS